MVLVLSAKPVPHIARTDNARLSGLFLWRFVTRATTRGGSWCFFSQSNERPRKLSAKFSQKTCTRPLPFELAWTLQLPAPYTFPNGGVRHVVLGSRIFRNRATCGHFWLRRACCQRSGCGES